MIINFQPITNRNLGQCVYLKVSDEQEQRHSVASNVRSLAQAYAEPWWVPLGIYAEDTIVGFVMYGRQPGTDINYILRVMVDEHYQGRGYGTAGLAALIDRI